MRVDPTQGQEAKQLPSDSPFGWVVNSPHNLEPVEGFTRDLQEAEKYRASGWTVTEVFNRETCHKLQTELSDSHRAYHRLNEHTNETEQYLDEAAELLRAIANSEQTYRECTDTSSPTGQRISRVVNYTAQFQPETHAVEPTSTLS
ncbi:hypothetical protein [Pseudomonas sp. NPDC096950]|uniref:hypothetical protein n=1 Tax=Pseudomonas sp. NPDC096950 TaxID=3364485 RepID=UPI00383B5A49